MFSKDPQPSARQNDGYDYNNIDPSGKPHFHGNITTVQLKKEQNMLSFFLSFSCSFTYWHLSRLCTEFARNNELLWQTAGQVHGRTAGSQSSNHSGHCLPRMDVCHMCTEAGLPRLQLERGRAKVTTLAPSKWATAADHMTSNYDTNYYYCTSIIGDEDEAPLHPVM